MGQGPANAVFTLAAWDIDQHSQQASSRSQVLWHADWADHDAQDSLEAQLRQEMVEAAKAKARAKAKA